MKLEANGLTFDVTTEGDGPAALLLHGFPDRARMWRNQISALVEAGYRVVAPDLRGFGDSDKPQGVDNYSLLYILEDVKGILDALEIDRAHVVGHDWGAAVGWCFASLYQDRVASLTAISVGHPAAFQTGGQEQLARSWYMFMFQFEGIAEEWIARNDFEFLRTWLSDPIDLDQRVADLARPGALTAGLNWYRANVPPSSWISDPPPLPPIAAPTMGVWSSRDESLGEDQMANSQKFVTGEWRYERIDDVGHWIPLEAPNRLNELLLDFFGSVDR